MLYENFQTFANLSDPWRAWAQAVQPVLKSWGAHWQTPWLGLMGAYAEQWGLMGFTHQRPAFLMEPVVDANGVSHAVQESVATATPFCRLVRFNTAQRSGLPKVLLVAPMSGHFATLLRSTVQSLVQDHEVYLTDWLNIRDIPTTAGTFDLDNYIEHVLNFVRYLGPKSHVVGVCQPTVACLAATSVMAEHNDPCTPASLTLMAGPIDTRINPTQVNALAQTKPIEWFEKNLIGTVPLQFAGAGRRVYPGFVQLTAFMGMNPDRHRQSFLKLLGLRSQSEHAQADQIRGFYEEYFAIMDLSAPFYLQTVEQIFQTHLLPKGELTFRGDRVDPSHIRKTFLLTVEGERDDICGMGQTLAAQDLCSRLAPYRKAHHVQAGVGHYGVFNGQRWHRQIYPVVSATIRNAHEMA